MTPFVLLSAVFEDLVDLVVIAIRDIVGYACNLSTLTANDPAAIAATLIQRVGAGTAATVTHQAEPVCKEDRTYIGISEGIQAGPQACGVALDVSPNRRIVIAEVVVMFPVSASQ
jgi:hypothetical protein